MLGFQPRPSAVSPNSRARRRSARESRVRAGASHAVAAPRLLPRSDALKCAREACMPRIAGIGRLGVGSILACGLADSRAVAFDIENVVADLESQTDAMAVAIECVEQHRRRGSRRPARQGARWRGSGRRSCARACVRVRSRVKRLPTAARSSAWPPAMPCEPQAAASVRNISTCVEVSSASAGSLASTSNASACSASPARIAVASPKATWQVGRPRRSASSSIAGRSSWTSE